MVVTNTIYAMGPNNSVTKRLWCTDVQIKDSHVII